MKRKAITGWGALSSTQKDALLAKYENGEPVSVMGMKQSSLKRRLREWREERESREFNTVQSGKKIYVEDENNITITTQNNRITTLDELLKFCKVDLKAWEVERYIVNSWEVGVRHEEKDLSWESGKLHEGYVKSYGGVNRENLIQVKAWLVRKQPIAIKPVITPVEFELGKLEETTRTFSTKPNSALIIPDIHFGFSAPLTRRKLTPFHDRNALSLVLDAVSYYEPKYIIVLGDLLDFTEWTDKFLRTPEVYNMTQPAIIEAGWFLSEITRRAPQAKKVYIEGNHEKRMQDMIMKHLAAGFNLHSFNSQELNPLWSVPNLLSLSSLGWEWVGDYPNGAFWLSDNLFAEHGRYVGQPGGTAPKVIKDLTASSIFGHIHRFELASKTLYGVDGAYDVFGFSSGFLGRLDGVVPPGKTNEQWQQGFSMVYFTEDGDLSLYPIPINNGQAIVDPEEPVWIGDGEALKESLISVVGNDWRF